jgi:hypothetical protein
VRLEKPRATAQHRNTHNSLFGYFLKIIIALKFRLENSTSEAEKAAFV